MLRKKNLAPSTSFQFRLRWHGPSGWSEPTDPILFTTLPSGVSRLPPPHLLHADSESITIAWEALGDGGAAYAVDIREGPTGAWQPAAAAIRGPAMRKKNLAAGRDYFFRVRPAADAVAGLPSQSMRVAELPPLLASLLGGRDASLELATGAGGGTALAEKLLAGKVVGLYCSASWCGPCRQFTPRLAAFYHEMKAAGKPFEVVLLSLDRDEAACREYHAHMPWPALPFDSSAREAALADLQVTGIPMLRLIGPRGGVAEPNAVAVPLSRQLIDRCLLA